MVCWIYATDVMHPSTFVQRIISRIRICKVFFLISLAFKLYYVHWSNATGAVMDLSTFVGLSSIFNHQSSAAKAAKWSYVNITQSNYTYHQNIPSITYFVGRSLHSIKFYHSQILYQFSDNEKLLVTYIIRIIFRNIEIYPKNRLK